MNIWTGIKNSKSLQALSAIAGIGQIIFPIALAIFTSGLIGLTIFAEHYLNIPLVIMSLIFSFLSVCLILSLIYAGKWALKISRARREDWNPDILVLEREVTITINTKTDVRYGYRTRICALRDGVSTYNAKVGWTGAGDMNVVMKNHRYTPWMQNISTSDYSKLVIPFDPLHSKSELLLEYTIETTGNVCPQDPFWSYTATDARLPRAFVVNLNFSNANLLGVWKAEFRSSDANLPISPPIRVADGATLSKVVHFKFRPKRRRKYCLYWEFAP